MLRRHPLYPAELRARVCFDYSSDIALPIPRAGGICTRAARQPSPVESQPVSKINWVRVLGGGLAAGVTWIVLGSVVTAVLGRDFAALPNNRLHAPTPAFIAFNVVIDLLEGISLVWLYAAIRPRYGPGLRTALIAAFAWWFVVTLGDATWCSFGLFPARTVVPLMIGTLPALVIATFVGAGIYRE
jgi:hypothetical protein